MAEKLITLSQLTSYDGKIKDWTRGEFRFVPKTTANTGYLKTYEFQVKGSDGTWSTVTYDAGGGQTANCEIDIPKDFFIKSATIEVCETADVPVEGYEVGDQYFDFIVNTSDDSETARHVYLKVGDAFAVYSAGNGIAFSGTTISADLTTNGGLELAGSTDGSKTISVKIGDGVKLDSGAVAVDAGDGLTIGTSGTNDGKVIVNAGAGLEIDSGAVKAKVDTTKGLAIDGTSAKIEVNKGTGLSFNASTGAIDVDAATATTVTSGGTYKGETATMPEASAANAGWVYKFTGTTDATYTNGKYYKSTESSGTYSWVEDTGASASAAGTITGAEKDLLVSLAAVLGTDVTLATTADINALF